MRVCIDIGGTKTLVAGLDDNGSIVREERVETPADYNDLIGKLVKLVSTFDVTDTTIVVGAPGKIDRAQGVVEGFGNLSWKNVPLKNDLETKIGKKIYIENDANLAALGEYYAISPLPHQIFYLTISTGIGSGVVTDGTLDPDHLDSEAGEMLIEHDGKLVMFEKLASGSAIVRDFGKRASDLNDPEAWQEVSAYLAHGIINILTMFQPNYIIIGGGVGTHFDKFKDVLNKELEAIKPPLIELAPIIQASQPEKAVLLGALQLSKQLDKA